MMYIQPDQDLIEAIARAFAANLKATLTPAQWGSLLAATPPLMHGPTCASHDYCDANMVMDVTLRDMDLTNMAGATWNPAWTLAKHSLFFANESR